MQKLARQFLAADAGSILSEVKENLETLLYSTQETTISVDAERPIRTIACGGGYERKRRGARKDLFGELIFKWQLRPLGQASKRYTQGRVVEIAGIASSVGRIKIVDDREQIVIASWRMEFGDSDSPGAYFHAQIPDTLDNSRVCRQMWPSWLPVPRLPIPAMTPMVALEFILAEIFQEDWPEHLASGGYEVEGWRAMQRRRYLSYLKWQMENVEDCGEGSPIVAAKKAKPKYNLFLRR